MGTNSVVLDLYKIAVSFQVQELLCEILPFASTETVFQSCN